MRPEIFAFLRRSWVVVLLLLVPESTSKTAKDQAARRKVFVAGAGNRSVLFCPVSFFPPLSCFVVAVVAVGPFIWGNSGRPSYLNDSDSVGVCFPFGFSSESRYRHYPACYLCLPGFIAVSPIRRIYQDGITLSGSGLMV